MAGPTEHGCHISTHGYMLSYFLNSTEEEWRRKTHGGWLVQAGKALQKDTAVTVMETSLRNELWRNQHLKLIISEMTFPLR